MNAGEDHERAGPKPPDEDDPMELVAVTLPEGDADLAVACLVEEFVRLGMTDAQLLDLFRRPFYAGAHAIWKARGEEHVRQVIARVRAQWGHPRFTVVNADVPDAVAPVSLGARPVAPGGRPGPGAPPPSGR